MAVKVVLSQDFLNDKGAQQILFLKRKNWTKESNQPLKASRNWPKASNKLRNI